MMHATDRAGAVSLAFVAFAIFALAAVLWHLTAECDARCGGEGRGVVVGGQCLCGPAAGRREP